MNDFTKADIKMQWEASVYLAANAIHMSICMEPNANPNYIEKRDPCFLSAPAHSTTLVAKIMHPGQLPIFKDALSLHRTSAKIDSM